MKVEKTIPINVELMTGNKLGKYTSNSIQNVNKNEDNTVYVNDCTKYPIKNDEE